MRSGYPQPRSQGNGNYQEGAKKTTTKKTAQAFAEEGRQEAVGRQAFAQGKTAKASARPRESEYRRERPARSSWWAGLFFVLRLAAIAGRLGF